MTQYLGVNTANNFNYRLKGIFSKNSSPFATVRSNTSALDHKSKNKENSYLILTGASGPKNTWDLEHQCSVTYESEEYYVVTIRGWSSQRSNISHVGTQYYRAQKKQNFSGGAKYIPVGAVEYNQNVLYLTEIEWVTYLAI